MVYVPRANTSFSPVWLSLRWSADSGDPSVLLAAAVESGLPLDLTRNAPLWRSGLGEEAFIVAFGGREAANAGDEENAANLVEASIFQASCALGQTIGLYVLDVRSEWTQEQMRGALAALELARSDGIVRFSGLACDDARILQSVWQDNDGFEFVLMSGEQWTPELANLGKQRGVANVAICEEKPKELGRLAAISLVGVRHPDDIQEIVHLGKTDC